MEKHLKRSDWDFSSLPAGELIPALFWETRRECAHSDQVIVKTRAWLDGKLSEKRPPNPKNKRTGKRQRYNTNFSEADEARIGASAVFGNFIPYYEFRWLHKRSLEQKRVEYCRWLASHIAPLVKYWSVPWLDLPETERQFFSKNFDSGRTARVVHVGSWWDAVGHFRKHKPDGGLPLKFDYSNHSSILLTIDWSYSQKRILAETAKLLKHFKGPGIKCWDSRGKKASDKLVILERLAAMRLLHHYTLSEIKRLAPDAWSLYQNRKWYDDRRQALKDFRSIIRCSEPEKFFPKKLGKQRLNAPEKITPVPGK